VVAILAIALLSAVGTAGFGYIRSGGRWGGHYSPLSYNHWSAPSVATSPHHASILQGVRKETLWASVRVGETVGSLWLPHDAARPESKDVSYALPKPLRLCSVQLLLRSLFAICERVAEHERWCRCGRQQLGECVWRLERIGDYEHQCQRGRRCEL